MMRWGGQHFFCLWKKKRAISGPLCLWSSLEFPLGHQREATALHLALTWIHLGTTFKCVSINIHTPCHVFSVESWHWGVWSAVFHTRKVTCYLNANRVPKNGARIWNDFGVVAVGCFGTSLLIMWLTVDHASAAWLNYFIPFMGMQKPAGGQPAKSQLECD